jgi:hypothetical protein
MNDFNRPYEKDYDHLDDYPQPDRDDLKNNTMVKLIAAAILIAVIVTALVIDTLDFIGKWG